MLTAIHALIYSDDPAATRRFFADVLRWPFVSEGDAGDAGLGGDGTGGSDPSEWLIFGTGLRREMADAAWQVGQTLPDWRTQAREFAQALAE